MTKRTALEVSAIVITAILIGIFYNLSNPNRLPFIGEKKDVDFSKSDSLLTALRIQDSISRIADSLKLSSKFREDSLRLVKEQRVKDSLDFAHKQDSIKRVNDSLNTVKKRIEDSLKALKNQTQDFAKPIDIKLDFAKALFDKKYRFIDARDEPDYAAGHVQGAVNVPYKKLEQFKSRYADFSKDEPVVIYCSSACDVSIDLGYYMAKEGFKKVYIFHGGWDDWKNAGYPMN